MLDQNAGESVKKIARFAQAALGAPWRDQGREAAGWDCWGLILAAYRDCFGLELPDLAGIPALNAGQVAALFARHARGWRPVPPGRERPGDVALFRRGRWPCHAGLVLAPGLLLHVEPELQTVIEPFDRGQLRQRLEGIYRYSEL